MKKLFPIVLCTIVALSCGKKEPVDNIVAKEDDRYLMAGVSNVAFDSFVQTKQLYVALTPTTAEQPTITLSMEGLPEGVTAKFATQSGAIPFTTDVDVTSNLGKGGTYDVKVVGTSDAGIKKSLPFKITLPDHGCYDQLVESSTDKAGTYTFAQIDLETNISRSIKGQFKNGLLYLNNVRVEGDIVEDDIIREIALPINCGDKTLSLPTEFYKSALGQETIVVEGNGTFDISSSEKKLSVRLFITNSYGRKKEYFMRCNL